MRKKLIFSFFVIVMLILTSCGTSPTQLPIASPTVNTPTLPTHTSTPSQTEAPTVTITPSQTELPTATITNIPPTSTASRPSLPDISNQIYLDDRSTPAALMLSYFNAVNRHEYLRAYSYYVGNTASLGTLEQFSSGYQDTQSVSVVLGNISSSGAAGSIYFTVPMVLNAITTGGAQQKYSACYILRWPQPAIYGAPPITPMHLDHGTAQSIPLTTSDADALASACTPPADLNLEPPSMEDLTDLSSANYIDNRSDPEAVIRSLLNAINSQEYVRAYSYWQEPSFSYDSFAAGYADTASVSAIFGTARSDVGAGQLYYTLPVVLESTLTNGTKQTFSACYTLHISQPTVQGTPPFQPLGIRSATAKQVENGSDPAKLLSTACP